MKKNLILGISLALVVLMSAGVIAEDAIVSLSPTEWQESDNGNNKYFAGVVWNGAINKDLCTNQGVASSGVTETYISKVPSKYCPGRKFLGICLVQEKTVDVNTLMTVTVPCPVGCEEKTVQMGTTTVEKVGQCISPVCKDTDGNYPLRAGVVELGSGASMEVYADSYSGNNIIEYYCQDGKFTSVSTVCPGVIKNSKIKASNGVEYASFYCSIAGPTCTKDEVTGVVTATNTKTEKTTFTDVCDGKKLVEYNCNVNIFYSQMYDINKDRVVDEADVTFLRDTCLPSGSITSECNRADLNGDKKADVLDLQIVTNYLLYNVNGDQVIKQEINCENGCLNKACIATSCIDSDRAMVSPSFVKGKTEVTSSNKLYAGEDICLGPTTLLEFKCPSATAQTLSYEIAICANGCDAGKCNTDLTSTLTDTLNEVQTKNLVCKGKTYAVKLMDLDSLKAMFTVNGESTGQLINGQLFTLSDGAKIKLTSITYQSYVGGTQNAAYSFSC
ncbi:MAG: dockerin type I repeat-containing protein [Candidatus Pacearchaeota archaeon]|jgi:hypothetical protein